MALDFAPFPSPVEERKSENALAPLRIVIAYDDNAAYQRALRVIVRVTDPERDEVHPLPWRFDVLRTVTGRVSAALELAKSQVLVVSVNGAGNFPLAITDWLQGVFAGLHGTPGLVIALLGAPGRADRPQSPRLQLLRHVAERAGWEFLAPSPTAASEPSPP